MFKEKIVETKIVGTKIDKFQEVRCCELCEKKRKMLLTSRNLISINRLICRCFFFKFVFRLFQAPKWGALLTVTTFAMSLGIAVPGKKEWTLFFHLIRLRY